jgi:hypothetical protein
MGVRARPRWALALLLLCCAACAACKAADDGATVGTPGLEPPKMTDDGGGLKPEPGSTDNPGTTPPPVVVGPGEFGGAGSTGSGAAAGASSGGSGAISGAGGAGGAGPMTPALDGGLDSGLDGGTGPGGALFEGLWVIEQPSHALYEATLYELSPSGAVDALETTRADADPWPGYVTGTVGNAGGSVRCVFAGQWRSLAERTIELDASCNDGTDRSVQLQLPADQDITLGVTPEVLSVAGESGWDHRDWPWSWRKCPSREACPPF